jgi:restriction system protein
MSEATSIHQLPGANLRNIDEMSGEQFEDVLEDLFHRKEFEVDRTPRFNDYGADLILTENDAQIAVQAKRAHGLVGLGAIQEVVAAKAHYTCTEAIVITSHFFTHEAQELAESNHVELWNRAVVRNELLAANMLDKDHPGAIPVCWKCGIRMVVRTSRKDGGSFYGCLNYPRCHCVLPKAADQSLWLVGAPSEPTAPASAEPLLSPDLRHWWDGRAWQDTAQTAPPGTPRSPDGYYWWDGTNWRLVPTVS